MKLLKVYLMTAVLSISGCASDDDGQIQFDPPTAQDFQNLQQNAFDQLVQTETFMAEAGISFTSQRNVTLNISPNCLTLNGAPVTGAVELEFVEIFERGNMAATNSTTVGINANNEREQLVSGGMFNIRAKQNGQELELSCGGMFLSVPAEITGGPDPEMRPFKGTRDANGDLVWIEQTTEFFIDPGQGGGSATYNAFIANFGWFNCDRFFNDPRPKTPIQIGVPAGFNAQNSAVYISVNGEPNSLGYVYGEFPIGLESHFIFLSEEDGNFRYAIKPITVAANQTVTFTLAETSVAPVAVVTQLLNDLP